MSFVWWPSGSFMDDLRVDGEFVGFVVKNSFDDIWFCVSCGVGEPFEIGEFSSKDAAQEFLESAYVTE